MKHHVLLCVMSAGCAAAPLREPTPVRAALFASPGIDGGSTTSPAPAAPAAAAPKLVGGDSYTRFAFGVFAPSGDISSLDSGLQAEIGVGRDVLPFLAVDLSLGYLWVDGSTDQEFRAVPLFLNGRVQLPLLIFGLYGGVGVGGLYADYKVGSLNKDEFLLAGQAFLGAEVGLGKLTVGAEYRYLATEENNSNFRIEGHSALVTLTLPF